MRRDELAKRRAAVGFSQENLAEKLGVDPSTVYRWEAGESTPQPATRPKLARLLLISVAELHSLLAKGQARGQEPPGDLLPVMAPIARAGTKKDSSTMEAFRTADRQVGGRNLYSSVVQYLVTDVAPRLFGTVPSSNQDDDFAAAAGLTEMAGWMAHDGGLHDHARQHFTRALELAKISGDSQLAAHVHASLSHLADYMKDPAVARALAQAGQSDLAGGPRIPALEAKLLAMEARAAAGLGYAKESLQLVGRAERALVATAEADTSDWVSHFDEGSLASETARCLLELRDFDGARARASLILELRAPDRTRSRAFAQLNLATALVRQRRPDEATAVIEEVVFFTHGLGSSLVNKQLLDLLALMSSDHPASSGLGDTLGRVRQIVTDRLVSHHHNGEWPDLSSADDQSENRP